MSHDTAPPPPSLTDDHEEKIVGRKQNYLQRSVAKSHTRATRDLTLVLSDNCCSAYSITQQDMLDNANVVTITVAGSYKFAEDLVGQIVIDSDAVTLDLCAHSLTSVGGTGASAGQFGVEIFGQRKDVTITNGSISTFRTAIFGLGDVGSELENICLTDLNLSGNGIDNGSFANSAIVLGDFTGGSAYLVKNVTIKRVKANGNLGDENIVLYRVDNLVMEDVQSCNTKCELAPGFPANIRIEFNNNVTITNSQFNGASNLFSVEGSRQARNIIENSSNVYLKNCQFNDSYGLLSSEVFGLLSSNNTNSVYENCQFNNIVGGTRNFNLVCGVHASDDTNQVRNSNGVKFINCQSNGLRTNASDVGFIVAGFELLTSQNVIFENCQTSNIKAEKPMFFGVAGISVFSFAADPVVPFADVNNIVLKECVASDIGGVGEVYGIYTGVGVNSSSPAKPGVSKNVFYDNCIVSDVHSTSVSNVVAGVAHRVKTAQEKPFELKNLSIKNTQVSDVSGGDPNRSAGILVEYTHSPVLSDNTVTDCVNGILLGGDTTSNKWTEKGLVQHNKVTNCSVTGYRDNKPTTSSAFLENVAFNNGSPATHDTNYQINWACKPYVSKGDLERYPFPRGLQNVSLLCEGSGCGGCGCCH